MFRMIGLVGLCLMTMGVAGAQVRVTAPDAMKAAVKKPQPPYSPVAKQMRIQGDVEVDVKISETGDVAGVDVVSGNAVLTSTVVQTVRDWKFTPFTQDGKPSAAVARLKFAFKI
ncbi:MAG: energy transducer TonB [Bryobacteraceae bacterium]|nr:energy transducer TonB [Bryobacteraceae bacterium]